MDIKITVREHSFRNTRSHVYHVEIEDGGSSVSGEIVIIDSSFRDRFFPMWEALGRTIQERMIQLAGSPYGVVEYRNVLLHPVQGVDPASETWSIDDEKKNA